MLQLEQDGTLRVVSHDTGPKVTEVLGSGITSYDWVYIVTNEHASNLIAALAACYEQHRGLIHDLLTSPEIAARFSNWHS